MRNKKFYAGLLIFSITVVATFAQQSLMSEATNKLFSNANDFIIKPNSMFNSLENSYVIVLGSYGKASTALTPNATTELGYYHSGKVPFSVSGSADFNFQSSGNKDWNWLLRSNIGIPAVNAKYFSNLSFGFTVFGEGNKRFTTQANNIGFSVPLGFQIGSVYNYLNQVYEWRVQKRPGQALSTGGFNRDNFVFYLFDKVTFKSIIPGGKQSTVWVAYSNTPTEAAELEVPAFGDLTNKKTNLQAGLSNAFEFSPLASISFIINPKLYFDTQFYDANTTYFGYTIASDVGVKAQLGELPILFFAAMTPRLRFYHTNKKTSQKTEHDYIFSTDILWSGRLGMTLLLPKNATADITANINTTNALINISAQFTIPIAPKVKSASTKTDTNSNKSTK